MAEPPEPDRLRRNQSKQPPLDLRQWMLPRGRHGLPREVVEQSQRERLLAAVVRVAAANGYRETSVADILEMAGVGRESFYKHFKDKEDCFLQANDALIDDLEEQAQAVYTQSGPWPERVRNTLEVMLDWLAVDPELPQVMLIEMGTVGPIAGERFRTTFGRFSRRLDEGRGSQEETPALPNIARIAGGAVFARVYEEVSLGNAAELPNLLPSLTFELLLPYLGEETARQEEQKAIEKIKRRQADGD